jgi:hypothetical protein
MRLRKICPEVGNAYYLNSVDFNQRFAEEPRVMSMPIALSLPKTTWPVSSPGRKHGPLQEPHLQFFKTVYQIQPNAPMPCVTPRSLSVSMPTKTFHPYTANLALHHFQPASPTSGDCACNISTSPPEGEPLPFLALIILGARALRPPFPNARMSPPFQKMTFLLWKIGDILSLG